MVETMEIFDRLSRYSDNEQLKTETFGKIDKMLYNLSQRKISKSVAIKH
jgi:hypothetical protein